MSGSSKKAGREEAKASHFDHVNSYAGDNDLQGCLDKFVRAGFLVKDKPTPHAGGLLAGFVTLTGTYLEVLTVEDEEKWQQALGKEDSVLRKHPRPAALGVRCGDSQSVYEAVADIYPQTQPTYSRAPSDEDQGNPIWKFCSLPTEATPGAFVFSVSYYRIAADRQKINRNMGNNTIFAIGGFVFCAKDREQEYQIWSNSIASIAVEEVLCKDHSICIGSQVLRWIDTKEYEELFQQSWSVMERPYTSIAAVRLLAEDLEKAAQGFREGGFHVVSATSEQVIVEPDANTGFAFIVEQGSMECFFNGLSQYNKVFAS